MNNNDHRLNKSDKSTVYPCTPMTDIESLVVPTNFDQFIGCWTTYLAFIRYHYQHNKLSALLNKSSIFKFKAVENWALFTTMIECDEWCSKGPTNSECYFLKAPQKISHIVCCPSYVVLGIRFVRSIEHWNKMVFLRMSHTMFNKNWK